MVFCDNCDKLFIPERSSENRGIFCTPECQKSRHYNLNKNLIRCQNKHRNRISAMLDTISNKNNIYPTKPKTPSAEQCKECKVFTSAWKNSNKIIAGQCPALLHDQEYIDFVNEYNSAISKG
jgi:DNA-directed RNA polymerase subunit M/transcription elongation factor TFIIS